MKQLTVEQAIQLGYDPARILPNGKCAGIRPMLYTVALIVGLDKDFYETRFCYPNRSEAEKALAGWDGSGDPPGPWIKEKGRIERLHPSLCHSKN